MSTIEAIVAAANRYRIVLARLNGSSVCSKVITHILRIIVTIIIIYLYIDKNFNQSTTVCSLARPILLSINLFLFLCGCHCSNAVFSYSLHLMLKNRVPEQHKIKHVRTP